MTVNESNLWLVKFPDHVLSSTYFKNLLLTLCYSQTTPPHSMPARLYRPDQKDFDSLTRIRFYF